MIILSVIQTLDFRHQKTDHSANKGGSILWRQTTTISSKYQSSSKNVYHIERLLSKAVFPQRLLPESKNVFWLGSLKKSLHRPARFGILNDIWLCILNFQRRLTLRSPPALRNIKDDHASQRTKTNGRNRPLPGRRRQHAHRVPFCR